MVSTLSLTSPVIVPYVMILITESDIRKESTGQVIKKAMQVDEND
jgi:hypothetical protein